MSDPPNGVQRELGVLIGEMRAINDRINRMDVDISRRLDRADDKRSQIYERIERLDENVASIDARASLSEVKIDNMVPAVNFVNDLRGKAGGVVAVCVVLLGLIGWFVYAFTDNIKAAIVGFFH